MLLLLLNRAGLAHRRPSCFSFTFPAAPSLGHQHWVHGRDRLPQLGVQLDHLLVLGAANVRGVGVRAGAGDVAQLAPEGVAAPGGGAAGARLEGGLLLLVLLALQVLLVRLGTGAGDLAHLAVVELRRLGRRPGAECPRGVVGRAAPAGSSHHAAGAARVSSFRPVPHGGTRRGRLPQHARRDWRHSSHGSRGWDWHSGNTWDRCGGEVDRWRRRRWLWRLLTVNVGQLWSRDCGYCRDGHRGPAVSVGSGGGAAGRGVRGVAGSGLRRDDGRGLGPGRNLDVDVGAGAVDGAGLVVRVRHGGIVGGDGDRGGLSGRVVGRLVRVVDLGGRGRCLLRRVLRGRVGCRWVGGRSGDSRGSSGGRGCRWRGCSRCDIGGGCVLRRLIRRVDNGGGLLWGLSVRRRN